MRAHVAALVLLLAFETNAAPAASGPTVALLPLVGSGLGADELARAERTLRREVDARFGKRSIKEQLLLTRLEQGSAAGLRCDRAQVACLVQLGIVCQADSVLVASIAPASQGAESTAMSLRLVDVLEGHQIAYASVVVASSPLPEEVSALLASLDLPPSRALSIEVKGAAGAAVFVDGVAMGSLPFAAPLSVTSGKHEVRVEGEATHVESVDVRPGELVVVDAPLPQVELQQVATGPDAPSAPVTPEPASFPLVPTLAGVGVVVVGTAALAVGVAPFIGYETHAARLNALDAEIGDDPDAVRARVGEVKAARDALEADEAAWNSYGGILAISGGALIVVGAGVVVGALLFME